MAVIIGPYQVDFRTNHLLLELGMLQMLEPVQVGQMLELNVLTKNVESKDEKGNAKERFENRSKMNIPGVGAPKNRLPDGAGAMLRAQT